jgi:hypothetical protein
MNKIEEFVYTRVKNNYVLKNFLRNMYQGFYDLLPNYESKFAVTPLVKEDCFFGVSSSKYASSQIA